MSTNGRQGLPPAPRGSSDILRYGTGLLAVACAGAVHWIALRNRLADDVIYLPYVAAVILTAWFAGRGPALLAAIVGPLAIGFPLAASDSLRDSLPRFAMGLSLYCVVCAAAILIRSASDRGRRVRAPAFEEVQSQSGSSLRDARSREAERLEHERTQVRDQVAREARLAAISQLSSSIAHDLRNPLGVIRNAVYLLRRRLAKFDIKPDLIDMIEEEVKSADAIITNLMETTRSREPERSEVDLATLAGGLMARIDSTGRVQWNVEIEPAGQVLWCDPAQFRQVLDNLLQNAVEAMRGKGPVTLAGWSDGPYDYIEVRDAGPGVAAEVRAHLFEPLVTTKRGGTGLGLMTCRQIVERHGGTIELIERSEPGAAFRVALPRKTTAAASLSMETVAS